MAGFGTMQIKWLTRLRFETEESPNFYHATEYRMPYARMKAGAPFKFTLENSRPTWDIRLMSYILDPLPGAKLKAGPITVSGVAYNDGKAPSKARNTRQPLCLVPMESARYTRASNARNLGASYGRLRPQPAVGRQDLLEPQRLRVDWCVQKRSDRHLTKSSSIPYASQVEARASALRVRLT